MVFQFVERLVEVRAGQAALQFGALGLMNLAIVVLDVGGVRQPRLRRLQADLRHRLAEECTVLGLVDRVGLRADHLDIVAVENTHAAQRQCGVERGLAAHGREQRVRALLGDDLGDDFRGDRLDIGRVGEARIGHDRRRVGVDEDDAVAFLLQRLTGLGAGIVEFACLTDDDRPRADDKNGLDILALRHGRSSVSSCAKNRPKWEVTGRARIDGLFRLEAAYRQMYLQAKPRKYRNRQEAGIFARSLLYRSLGGTKTAPKR
ncbi:hypothetical protein D9M68_182060 [compost metagenome]